MPQNAAMKTKLILLTVLFFSVLSAKSQLGLTGNQRNGAQVSGFYHQRPSRNTTADGISLRMVNGEMFNADKSVLFKSVSGEVTAESDGLVILHCANGQEVAIKNYTGIATSGKKIFALGMKNGIYKWGDSPLQIYDCGRPYIPPPPTPAQIAAAQKAARIVALRERQKVLEGQTNAVHWLLSQATNGDASAQCSLGLHYLNGQGCETNQEQAIYWLTQAANQGDTEASNKLAIMKP